MPCRKKVSRVVKSQDAKIIAGIHRAKFARCRRVPRLRAGKCGGHLFETGQRQLAQPVRSCRDRAQHAAPLQRAGAERLGLLCLGLRRGGGFRCCHEGRECRGVLHGNIREHLAVESDARGFEAVNQLAVGQAVQAGGCADTLNPQAAVLAFLDAAVALGVTIGAIGGFLCGLVELALGEEKAFCPLEVLLAPCTALGAAFYASHGFLLLGGKQNRLRRRKEKHASCNGFVSGMNCLPHFTIALRRWVTSAAYRPAGTREALPGTICGTCVPHFPWRAHPKAALLEIRIDQRRNSNLANGRWSQKGRSMLRPYMETLAVGKHLLDAGHVGFIYERELFQLAHAAGPFCTHQVALAGVPALDLAVRRELEALPGAAVGLQLQFRFRSVSRHCWKSSPDLKCVARQGAS